MDAESQRQVEILSTMDTTIAVMGEVIHLTESLKSRLEAHILAGTKPTEEERRRMKALVDSAAERAEVLPGLADTLKSLAKPKGEA